MSKPDRLRLRKFVMSTLKIFNVLLIRIISLELRHKVLIDVDSLSLVKFLSGE